VPTDFAILTYLLIVVKIATAYEPEQFIGVVRRHISAFGNSDNSLEDLVIFGLR
jgi:hypothetical protein